MKVNYWPLGFAVAVFGLLLPWFDPVTTPRFNALKFPFAHSAYLWPHFILFSYGTTAIGTACVGCSRLVDEKGTAGFLCRHFVVGVGNDVFSPNCVVGTDVAENGSGRWGGF